MRIKISMLMISVSAILLSPLGVLAENEANKEEPLYVSLECMKSSAASYAQLETEIWLPMHQALVDQGKRNSWALYWVRFGDRSQCDYYTVTTYSGQAQLDSDPDYGALFAAVHPDKDVTTSMARTWRSREHVYSELWLRVDSTDIEPHRYAIVNLMRAEDPDAYERMESMVFKAAHQSLVDDGHRAGWAVYELVSPTGSELPYNYSTVDLVNNLAPAPMADAMIDANPDRDLEEMHNLLELREHVRSETWALVSATNPPKAE